MANAKILHNSCKTDKHSNMSKKLWETIKEILGKGVKKDEVIELSVLMKIT